MTAFAWREVLDLAEYTYRLAQSGSKTPSPESAYRCTCSRAYYAAFCHACVHAESHAQWRRIPDYSDHSRIRSYLRDDGKQELADKLQDLHDWRKLCDYSDSVGNVDWLAMYALDWATNVIDAL